MSFPRSARLRRRAEFQRAYRYGIRVTGKYVVLFAIRRNAAENRWTSGRLGVTASRKTGGAVIRSRCKRRLRELYRLYGAELGAEAVDLVVNARKGCAHAPWSDLEADFRRGLRALRSRLRRA